MIPEDMDMSALLSQAQAMQEQLAQVQQEMANATFTGTAGGGLVSVVITGGGDISSLTIKPEAVDMDDLDSLSDLIIAAIRDATAQAGAKAQSILPDLSGMGF